MLGAATGRAVQDRVAASVAAAVLAVERGANIVRVHDVAATRDALRVLENDAGPQRPMSTRRKHFGTDACAAR